MHFAWMLGTGMPLAYSNARTKLLEGRGPKIEERQEMKTHILKSTVVALLVAGLVGILHLTNEPPSERVTTGFGDVRTLRATYDRWTATYTRGGGDRRLILPLHYSKGLSAEFSEARGQATLDLTDGSVAVDVSGLSDTEAFDVWLVDNRPGPGHSVDRKSVV